MGRVYLARHVRLGRLVAIKMLRTELTRERDAVDRFLSEARAVNHIRHKHIIEITDFREDERGRTYYVMELLQGTTLAREIRGGPLPLDRTLRITLQIADALHAVHEAGIVHRDLKPGNVFLDERYGRHDFVKVLDFGVAKLTGSLLAERGGHETVPGAIMGTPIYMSPEQASGVGVDERSDIYSFGVILFEMLAGQPPFGPDAPAKLLEAHRKHEAPRLDSVCAAAPQAIVELVRRSLAKPPEDRPTSMSEVTAVLEQALDDLLEPDTSSTMLPPSTGVMVLFERRRSLTAAVAFGAALVLALVAALWGMDSEPPVLTAPASTAQLPVAAQGLDREPTMVTVKLSSEPPRANVRHVGTDRYLGKTPLEVELPRGEVPAVFEVSRPGYALARRQIDLSTDADVAVDLRRVRARHARAPGALAKREEPSSGAAAPPSERGDPAAQGAGAGRSAAPEAGVGTDADGSLSTGEGLATADVAQTPTATASAENSARGRAGGDAAEVLDAPEVPAEWRLSLKPSRRPAAGRGHGSAPGQPAAGRGHGSAPGQPAFSGTINPFSDTIDPFEEQ